MEQDPHPSGPLVTAADVERELLRLFHADENQNLVVRVQGVDDSEARQGAFRELLESLAMYGEGGAPPANIVVAPPDEATIARALAVLGQDRLQRRLFERILSTFGRRILDPLAKILDRGPGGPLASRMLALRNNVLLSVEELRMTQETQKILTKDLLNLLSDDYLKMLTFHEDKVQRPRVKKLAKEALHLVGTTFQRAFQSWPENADRIAHSVARRFSGKLGLGEHPIVLRQRIVEAIAEFLWVETSAELSGSLYQLLSQNSYSGLVDSARIELTRSTYDEFAEACWDLVAEYC